MLGNPIALAAFIGFVPFCFYVFRRNSTARATAIIVLTGSLLLPEVYQIKIPMIPSIDKERVTYLAALLALLAYHQLRNATPRIGFGLEAVLLLVVVGRLLTMSMNGQPILNEGEIQDGIGIYWLVSYTIDDFLIYVAPFLVGRIAFRSEDDLKTLLQMAVWFGLLYTALIVIEILMSVPFRVWQLSQVIYGIPMRPMWRWGWIQPIVFMDNGLAIASFMAIAAIAAAGLIRAREGATSVKAAKARPALLAGLLMTWNVAGNVYGFAMTIAFKILGRSNLRRLAIALALLPCIYPGLRMADVFPAEQIVEFAYEVDADRGKSLEGRFLEEDFVLGNIGDRLWVGWAMYDRIPGAASFGRGETGLDSWWIIRAGMTGLIGVELIYLMLGIPVLMAARRVSRLGDAPSAYLLLALMLCVAVRMNDLLINGWFNCLPAFLSGALYGVVKSIPIAGRRTSRLVSNRSSLEHSKRRAKQMSAV
ncbi:MAG: hypothetical protein RIB46_07135 [Pseudomonadales bacterium]